MSAFNQNRQRDILWIFQSVMLTASVIGVYTVLLTNLSTGYELGDHGFYLLHIRQPEYLSYTFTQYGMVWNFILGSHGVAVNRLLNILLVSGSVVFLYFVGWRLIDPVRENTTGVLGVLISLAVSSTLFLNFIVDPSYNSLGFILIVFGFALAALCILMEQRGWRVVSLILAMAVGAVVAAMLMTKISSAILFVAVLFVVATWVSIAWRSYAVLFRMILSAMIGFGVFVGVFQLLTGMMPHVISSVLDGARVYAINGTHSTRNLGMGAIERLVGLYRDCLSAIMQKGWVIVVPAVLAFVGHLPIVKRSGWLTQIWIDSLLVFGIAALSCYAVFADLALDLIYQVVGSVFAVGFVITLCFLPFAKSSAPRWAYISFAIAVPFICIYGTTNGYFGQVIGFGAGLSLLPAWMVLSSLKSPIAMTARHLVVALAAFVAILSAESAIKHPYRMAGDLAAATVSVQFPQDEQLNVTPAVAAFVDGLMPYAFHDDAQDAGAATQVPTIFDLTGQVPISVILLNGRPPGVAWIMDVYGPNLSRAVFAEMNDGDFQNGWALVPVDKDGSLVRSGPLFVTFEERLAKMGLQFDTHFKPVGTVTAPVWGQADAVFSMTLFKPVR